MRTCLVLACILALGCQSKKTQDVVLKEEDAQVDLAGFGMPTLSGYGLFTGDMRNLMPVKDVFPYDINAALFSDYAFKKRLIKLPSNGVIRYKELDTFDFPEGTILIKNFYYPADFNKPDAAIRILETRLLILEQEKWKPLTYIWNDEQTEAYLDVAGKEIPISWVDTHGVRQSINYSVPSNNQCKGCHLKGDQVMPIGPSARQLNRNNQLVQWQREGHMVDVPKTGIPRLADYDNVNESVSVRARAWLEINCAHCHRPDGQAKTSGLHLMADLPLSMETGIGKKPVAAGKGSGGRRFSIVPGKPEESILVYRLESTDPGIMMPEMGRKLVHQEGVDLVRKWIEEMKP